MPSDNPPPEEIQQGHADPSSPPLPYRSTADDRATRRKGFRATLAKLTIVILVALGVLIPLMSLRLPSYGRSREAAQRVKCAANLRQIGQVCQLFANENNGRYPVSISIPFAEGRISVDFAFCPNHRDQVPTTLPSHLLDARSDYLYLGAGLTTSIPDDMILLYERPGPHGPDGVNVLFADGRAEFLTLPALQKALESSHTQRQLWERRRTGTQP